MTITESQIKTLRQLVTQDKTLLARAQDAPTVLDVARIMAQAGCAHGISLTPEALLPHLEKATLQPTPTELTETQLVDVVGGATYTIDLRNRTPTDSGIFQLQRDAFAKQDQQTRDWLRQHWFTRP